MVDRGIPFEDVCHKKNEDTTVTRIVEYKIQEKNKTANDNNNTRKEASNIEIESEKTTNRKSQSHESIHRIPKMNKSSEMDKIDTDAVSSELPIEKTTNASGEEDIPFIDEQNLQIDAEILDMLKDTLDLELSVQKIQLGT